MKLPRDLSGAELVKHLCRRWEYRQVHQVGSHVILETDQPGPQRIAVPEHRPLRVGTLNAILSAVASHKGVTKEDVLKGI
jgi:predicted RNA binding protein YcfA (HicA-like mRNA interferase family)